MTLNPFRWWRERLALEARLDESNNLLKDQLRRLTDKAHEAGFDADHKIAMIMRLTRQRDAYFGRLNVVRTHGGEWPSVKAALKKAEKKFPLTQMQEYDPKWNLEDRP